MNEISKKPSFYDIFLKALTDELQTFGVSLSSSNPNRFKEESKPDLWARAAVKYLLSKETTLLSTDLTWAILPGAHHTVQFIGTNSDGRHTHGFSLRLFQRISPLASDIWMLDQDDLSFDTHLMEFFSKSLPLVRNEWSSEITQQRFQWSEISPALVKSWKIAILTPWMTEISTNQTAKQSLLDRCFDKQDSYWFFGHGKNLSVEPIQRTGRLGFPHSLKALTSDQYNSTAIIQEENEYYIDISVNHSISLRGQVIPVIQKNGRLAIKLAWSFNSLTPELISSSKNLT
jgi:hypothetical protein